MNEPRTVTIEPSPQAALLAARLVDAAASQDPDIMDLVAHDLLALGQREMLQVQIALAGSVIVFARALDPDGWREHISTGLLRLTAVAAESP